MLLLEFASKQGYFSIESPNIPGTLTFLAVRLFVLAAFILRCTLIFTSKCPTQATLDVFES